MDCFQHTYTLSPCLLFSWASSQPICEQQRSSGGTGDSQKGPEFCRAPSGLAGAENFLMGDGGGVVSGFRLPLAGMACVGNAPAPVAETCPNSGGKYSTVSTPVCQHAGRLGFR